jgi:hypothetical protein
MSAILATSKIKKSMLTKDFLIFLFHYNDGNLYWRRKPAITSDLSKPAGSINGGGFREIRINRNRYRVDFLVWVYHNDVPHGSYKIQALDKDKLNTRIENLILIRD